MAAKFWLLAALAVFGAAFLLPSSVAYAHGGVEPGANLLTAWNANPLPSLALFLVVYLYINGLSRWPSPSHPINGWQKFSFFAGVLAIFLALQSPIDPLAKHLFSIHQLQHVLLRMIGPILVLGGAPLTPMLRGLPLWALQGIVRPVVKDRFFRRTYNWFTNPVVTTFIFLGTLYLWQVPTLHDLAVRNDLVHELMHVTMLVSGFLFWWLVIDPKPHRSRLHYGLRVLYLGLIVIPNTVLGASIVFNGNLLYQSYQDFAQPLSMAPLTDQQIGGLLLWVVGDMMSILAAGVVMIMWYQQEQAQEEVWGAASD
ncbi:MAG: cytochrome c oxidase assembly protein [Chloroflexi bacterium]|nr:cytochrome c oxidase assembly protein [Chloroflexota bacterium]MDA1219709.1 cytochrome c oxidase assembly protein [Chloroflexota bacterium]